MIQMMFVSTKLGGSAETLSFSRCVLIAAAGGV